MGDDPTEQVQEDIHHHATHGDEHAEGHGGEHAGHGGGHGHGPKWITAAALTAAFLAALAAISSSLASKHLTQSTLKRIAANDEWNLYQSKGIKSSEIDSRAMAYNLSIAAGAKIPDSVVKQYKYDQSEKAKYKTPVNDDDPVNPQGTEGMKAQAEGLQVLSEAHLDTHETFEMSETMFHIAIAVVAIAVVAKRREFWYMSMVGGVIGLYFFGTALAGAPHESEPKPEAAATQAVDHAATHAAPHPSTAPG